MSRPPVVTRRRSRLRLLVSLAVLLVVFGVMLFWSWDGARIEQREAVYLPAPVAGRLATVEAAPDRVDEVGCVFVHEPDDEVAAVSRTCPGDLFELAGHLYRLDASSGGGRRIELVGARLESGVIGAAREAARQLRLPGVGAEHIELLAPGDCPDASPCVRSLVGGRRTLLEQPGAAVAPLVPGRLHTLAPGDVLWLGLSPLVVGLEPGEVTLALPPDYEDHRGARGWIHDPAPRFGLAGPGPWELRSERDLYLEGHLETRRIDRQLEEEIQRLVDEEVICLEPGVPRSDQPPRVIWADGRGCSADFVQPVHDRVAALRTRYRHHPGLLSMIDRANRHLADGSYVARPEVLNFTFDWSFMVAPWADGFDSVAVPGDEERDAVWSDVSAAELLVPVPTRLLGIWWGRTEHGVPPASRRGLFGRLPRVAVDGGPPFDIRVRSGSTSAQLRVDAPDGPIGALRDDDLLLLTGSSPPVVVEIDGEAGALLGSICEGPIGDSAAPGVWRRAPPEGSFLRLERGPGQPDSRAIYGAVFPLGRLVWSPSRTDRLAIGPLVAPSPDGCLYLARTEDGTFWSATPAGAEPAARVWQQILPGDRIPLSGGALVLRDNGDLAATSLYDDREREWRRLYPFEEDAGQLIGRGRRHYSGLEASLEADLRARVDEDLELTLHGDLQRIVSRALTTAMEVELARATGSRREVKRPGTRRGSAVLMDSDTGQVLAAATWPPFDPNLSPQEEDAWRSELRARGTVFDPAENWAFVRNRAAGSTYKLATGIALGRAGLLAGADRPATGAECSGGRGTWDPEGGLRVYRWLGDRVTPRGDPERSGSRAGSHHKCVSNHAVIPRTVDAIGPTFVQAFARSCNVWFSLATYRLMHGAVPMGGPVSRTLDRSEPDLGLGEGPLLFRVRGRLGLLWPKDRPIEQVIAPRGPGGAPRNRHTDTLLELGHRFFYPTSGGVVTQQEAHEWAPGMPYPTAGPERAWLAGLRPGLGFRYPELAGPAAFGGSAAWPDGTDPPLGWEGGRLSGVPVSRSYRGAAVVGWGQEVGASTLSLAAMTSVAGSSQGRAPTPRIVLDPDPLLPAERGRALDEPPPVLLADHAPVRAAMKAVVSSGTGRYIFGEVLGLQRDAVVSRVGGKTGTIQTSVPVSGSRQDLRDSLRRVRFFACGVLLPDELRGGSPEQRDDDVRFEEDWSWFVDEMGAPPTFGFASSGALCRSLVPGAPSTLGRAPGTEHEPGPVERWEALYSRRSSSRKMELVDNSAFVAAVFDGFVPAPPELPDGAAPSLATGGGLALAVIADNHPTAAKEAAAAILNDLLLYYQVRGDALPRER